jgi:hypothetical protein
VAGRPVLAYANILVTGLSTFLRDEGGKTEERSSAGRRTGEHKEIRR